MPKDQSQIDDMRAAIRGDIERARARQNGTFEVEPPQEPPEEVSAEPALAPEPVAEAAPEATPEPVVVPEPVEEAMPEPVPEPVVDPEPVVEAEPEPVGEPEPEWAPEPIARTAMAHGKGFFAWLIGR